MENDIDVSIIILSFNTSEMTLHCLQSVFQETISCRYEVIAVDNASSDGSPEHIQAAFPSVVLIKNRENLGFAAANNQGIGVAKGRYVLLLNSDTIVLDGAIDGLVIYLDMHPDVSVVGPRLIDGQGNLHLSARLFPTLRSELFQALHLHVFFPRSRLFGGMTLSWWDHKSEREVDSVEGSALLLRKSIIDQIGLLDAGYFFYSEDIDWCWRVKKAGYKIAYYPEVRLIHFGGGSGYRRSPKLALDSCRSKIRFFEQHYGDRQAEFVKVILLIGIVVRLTRLWFTAYIIREARTSKEIVLEIQGLKGCIKYLLNEIKHKIDFRGFVNLGNIFD